MLSIIGLNRRFPTGTEALRNVSLLLQNGDFLALLGPSGCGKSTLLRLIAGLDQPDDGALVWDGGPPAPGDIGYVFQDATLLPWATAEENVFLPLRLRGVSRAAAMPAVQAVLHRVGLAGFEKARSRQLSGGMRMRVSIARALVTKPRLLLMDEPFAALDEITRFKLNNDLLQLWQALGTTIVFVTHSVFESVYLSNRVVVMAARPGRVFTELKIDAPYPRDRDFRTSAEYAASCRRASEALAQAMGAGGER